MQPARRDRSRHAEEIERVEEENADISDFKTDVAAEEAAKAIPRTLRHWVTFLDSKDLDGPTHLHYRSTPIVLIDVDN